MLDNWLPFLIYGTRSRDPTLDDRHVVRLRDAARSQGNRTRALPFESGVSQGPPHVQRFTISFYLTALLFIVFDIEIVFLYLLADVLEPLGWFGFWELAFFLGILALAYVYIWRKGALDWRR